MSELLSDEEFKFVVDGYRAGGLDDVPTWLEAERKARIKAEEERDAALTDAHDAAADERIYTDGLRERVRVLEDRVRDETAARLAAEKERDWYRARAEALAEALPGAARAVANEKAEAALAEARGSLAETLAIAERNESGPYADRARAILAKAQGGNEPATPAATGASTVRTQDE